jgi:predicted dehydrogenase
MIKIGVIGVGHLGSIHLRLLKEIPDYEVVGVYDIDQARAAEMANEYGVTAFESLNSLIDAVDAVDIVTPTLTHYECAKAAMKRFKHVFIEKPVTHTIEEANSLINLAREAKIKAMVGHVERFNPAFLAVKNMDLKPMFIESHRLAKWNPRGTDVSVVLDLMIHDIDIIQSIVNSAVKRVSASGVPVVSDTPDIANVRIEFDNGCVANLTASRISLKNMRRIRVFQRNGYVSVDFLDKTVDVFHINDETATPDPNKTKFEFKTGDRTKYLTVEHPKVEPVNSIKMELEEFARAINQDTQPLVTLEQATSALKTAYLIAEKINDLCIV